LEKALEAHCHNIAKACLRDAGLGIFWRSQGHKLILAECASKLPETSGQLKAIILPGYACKMPGWATLGKHKAIILPKGASEMLAVKLVQLCKLQAFCESDTLKAVTQGLGPHKHEMS